MTIGQIDARRGGRDRQSAAIEPLMTTAEVARLLQVSKPTVSRWRTCGTGPEEIAAALVWLSEGIPRYRSAAIYAFVRGGRSS